MSVINKELRRTGARGIGLASLRKAKRRHQKHQQAWWSPVYDEAKVTDSYNRAYNRVAYIQNHRANPQLWVDLEEYQWGEDW